ncbi:MAG: hydroxymethylbilane synthase [bacterium]
MKDRITIGTRGSRLAQTQADWVGNEIKKSYKKEVFIKKIKTKGDTIGSAWEKGFFVKEIEEALLRGEIDIAVHSMKDLPTDLPDGLMIGAVPKRIEPGDVLVSKGNLKLDQLGPKSLIGTSSLRRKAQILAYRPDLCVQDLRGNLDTRLKKLEEGQFSAIVVAGAGLIRMGWQDRITQIFSSSIILPAAGQGALAIEIRSDDGKIQELVEGLNDKDSHICIEAERSFLKTLGGGCQVPIGVLAELCGSDLEIFGMTVDGERITRSKIRGERKEAILLGERLAKGMRLVF